MKIIFNKKLITILSKPIASLLIFVLSLVFFIQFIQAEFNMNSANSNQGIYGVGYGYGYNYGNGYGYNYGNTGGYGYNYGNGYGNSSNGSNSGGGTSSIGNSLFSINPRIYTKYGEIVSNNQTFSDKPIIKRIDSYVELKQGTTYSKFIKTIIEIKKSPIKEEVISIDLNQSIYIQKVKITLPLEFLNNVYENFKDGVVKIDIRIRDVIEDEKKVKARNGNYIIGFDVVQIDVYNIKNKKVKDINNKLLVKLDISNFDENEDYKILIFNKEKLEWEIFKSHINISNSNVLFKIDHSGSFAIARDEKVEEKIINQEFNLNYSDKDSFYIKLKNAESLNNFFGNFLMEVKKRGEAWYVNGGNQKAYFLGNEDEGYEIIKGLGVGIINGDLEKIMPGIIDVNRIDTDHDGLSDELERAFGTNPLNRDTDSDGYNDRLEIDNGYSPLNKGKMLIDENFSKNSLGKIFLQIEDKGRIWYINPADSKRYYIGSGAGLFSLIARFGIGILDINFSS